MRSKSFRRRRDAERFDMSVKDAQQTGTLAALDGGSETLDDYVENTWTPIHAAPLAPKTRDLYASLYDGHVSPGLGGYRLRELTPEVIGRWQADRLAAGAPVESTRKSLTLVGGILQRALEAGRITSNPQRLVRKAAPAATEEVRPLAPVTVERICVVLRPRDAMFVYLLAYAGLRPQEARALRWGHVGERTLTVHAPKTRRHSTQPRSVRLLAPLAQGLREWRLLSGRPDDAAAVIPAFNGNGTFVDHDKEWTENGYELWITRVWATALKESGCRTSARTTCGTASPRCCCTRADRSSTSPASSGTRRTSRCARTGTSSKNSTTPRGSAPRTRSPLRAVTTMCVRSASRSTDVMTHTASNWAKSLLRRGFREVGGTGLEPVTSCL